MVCLFEIELSMIHMAFPNICIDNGSLIQWLANHFIVNLAAVKLQQIFVQNIVVHKVSDQESDNTYVLQHLCILSELEASYSLMVHNIKNR